MNRPAVPAVFRRNALAAAVSSLYLLPALLPPQAQALGSALAEPGPVGPEFQVNTVTAGTQSTPAVGLDADGDSVVVWTSYATGDTEIRGQRYNAAGQPQSGEFQINTVSTNTQRHPSIAVDAVGDFVVAWDSDATDNSEIRAQRFNAAGQLQGAEFQVNTLTANSQAVPTVAMDADGDFVIAWQSNATGDYDVRAQRFNAVGQPQGGEFRVNTVTTLAQRAAAVALDADGDFLVAWQSDSGTFASGYDIFAQRYNAAGIAQGGEFRVNTVTTDLQYWPALAVDAVGDFVVSWENFANVAFGQIHAQRYNAAGQPQGGEFPVSTLTTGRQYRAKIALDADGDFVVVWTSGNPVDDGEIHAKRYNAEGLAQGEELRVSTSTLSDGITPAVALDADGDFVVAWTGYTVRDIRARRFQGPHPVDVSLVQTDSADPSPAGSPLSYSLSAGNLHSPVYQTGIAAIDNAIATATGLRVVDTLPAGSTAISATGLNWNCSLPVGRVVCDYALTLLPGDETNPVTVRLTPPNSPGALLSNVGRAFANQFDGDPLNNREVETTQLVCAESVIQLSASSYTVSEGTANATITATRSGGGCGVATVQFDTAGSSASAGLDFTDVTGTLTWANGDLANKTFSIPINNDGLDEIDERLLLSFTGARGASLGSRNAARLTITDDDAAPRVNFRQSTQSVPEAPGLVTVTARLGALSGRAVSIPLTFSGTATNGSDYFPSITVITIPAGQFESSADIEIAGDSTDEPNETIIVDMGAVTGATVGSINTDTLTILDNDP